MAGSTLAKTSRQALVAYGHSCLPLGFCLGWSSHTREVQTLRLLPDFVHIIFLFYAKYLCPKKGFTSKVSHIKYNECYSTGWFRVSQINCFGSALPWLIILALNVLGGWTSCCCVAAGWSRSSRGTPPLPDLLANSLLVLTFAFSCLASSKEMGVRLPRSRFVQYFCTTHVLIGKSARIE